jgi:LuxR family maltose regulon positive regulatory protein
MTPKAAKIEERFIHEKIVIPETPAHTLRERLLNMLGGNLVSAKATILNGRAGTGKTTLACDFARHAGLAVAWYKVDAADNDLRVFCEYLSASVRLQRPSIQINRLLDLTEAIEMDRAELSAEEFVFQLSENRSEPLLIVVEDLHLVYDAEWVVPFFRRVLPLLPDDVHLLITCRSLPPAPLWRLRSKQMLRVIEESELAFTVEEAIELFRGYGLSPEHARIGVGQTAGRAAAICEFAATPGRAGRAVADKILSLKRSGFPMLPHNPDCQI